jgi:hypothetical protein
MTPTKRFVIILILFFLCSCAAGPKANPGDDIVTTITGNAMIQPPMQGQNNVLVKITNPTEQKDLDVCQAVKNGLTHKGYNLVDFPEAANYTVMGHIVQAGQTEPQLLQEAYRSKAGTRLSLTEPNTDILAKAVGKLTGSARGKAHILILDLSVGNRQQTEKRRMHQENKIRIVSGIQNTRISEIEIMPLITDKVVHTVVSLF